MTVKRVQLSDLEGIMKIEKKVFKGDAFSRETIKKLMVQNNLFLKIEDKKISNKIIGFIIAIKDDEERINIVNFVVKKRFQELGYGSILLKEALEKIRKLKQIKTIILNVKTSNKKAIDLYKKFDFRIVGKIEKYYSQNESAYLMELKI
ncbi:MAG: ribosomal protein S18-alanine N-acetyltransferase [Candidatus Hodarchaeota archaeon]